MSWTILELTRACHEAVERLERIIVKDLQTKPSTNKTRLVQSHRICNVIHQINETTHRMVEFYEDKDHAMKQEIAGLSGQAVGNVFSTFYDGLKEIRECHRRPATATRVVEHVNDDAYFDQLLRHEPHVQFSGEEVHGRCVDLHEIYNDYVNSKFGQQIEYSTYLDLFSKTSRIPRNLKLSREYKGYMNKLLDYLVHFFERVEPLQDLDTILSKVTYEGSGRVAQSIALDLDNYSSVEELVGVGAERLKEALGACGLKTGGTLQLRAERLFLTKHTSLEALETRHFAKKRSRGLEKSNEWEEIVLMESKVEKLCELLRETIARTKENVVKKQALTYEEMEAEREDGDMEEDDDEVGGGDDDEREIHNPLKLPMGWDGKPIPYWLYKFHGLNQEFNCEICGNQSYWGRRAYERHFNESKHRHGMRCLGITFSRSFNEITSIEEAKKLWEKIQEKEVNKWQAEVDEEYEDEEGNVYGKKTFLDLQRQGLI